MDVSEATIEKLYENYALASKVYTSLTTGVNEEVSDDEAKGHGSTADLCKAIRAVQERWHPDWQMERISGQ